MMQWLSLTHLLTLLLQSPFGANAFSCSHPNSIVPTSIQGLSPSALSAISDRKTTSGGISTYGRIFPSNIQNIVIVEPQIKPLISGDNENEHCYDEGDIFDKDGPENDESDIFDKNEPTIITNSETLDDEDHREEEKSNVQDSHEKDNEESADVDASNDKEDQAKLRAKAAILRKLAGKSSNRSRKNISESKERGGQKETSIGKRRVGAASRARSGRGGVGSLLGSVRTSAAAAAALKQKKKDPDSSSSKGQSTNNDTNKGTSAVHKKTIIATIDSLIQAQDEAKYYTNDISIGLLGERIHYSSPRPRSQPSQIYKLHRDPELKQQQQQQQQVSLSTLPKTGTVVMHQEQQLGKRTLITRQHLRKFCSITVAGQSDYAAIAELRLSVYGGSALTWKKKWIDRTCEMLNERRLKGITCLTACVNYVDTKPWLIGSIECSSHEFEGTGLGMRRPTGTILYITEVAVSTRCRRGGIGLSLLKAMDKIATIRNVETLYLHVDVENIAARALYEKTGYKILDSQNEIYAEFTRKLNLHRGGTTGREHHLMQKKVTKVQTWLDLDLDQDNSKSQRGTLGFDVLDLLP